eukprot:TRINITY_DN4230_c0_g1_i1.p1 TRINITY_DN4230_c0_g1~~TRINITY_DN4230_c0_g1_i1.p1  ORF type:complete len:201 (+),score=24.25 TRINITY_DN4230_c0_g1_i1:102-704(+)
MGNCTEACCESKGDTVQKVIPLTKGIEDRQTREATLENGSIYIGQWKGNVRDGIGKQTWPDGAVYEGAFSNNKAEGYGKFTHVDGDVYEGEWEDDKANGTGKYQHIDGSSYEGEWIADKQTGLGVENWSDGSSYRGQCGFRIQIIGSDPRVCMGLKLQLRSCYEQILVLLGADSCNEPMSCLHDIYANLSQACYTAHLAF